MISKIDDFLLNIEKKEKVIKYLKTIYKVEVGEEAMIPDVYIDGGMRLDSLQTTQDVSADSETQFSTLKEKINSLKLPEVNDKDIKNKIAKMKKERNPLLIKEVNLANYGDKGMSLELFKRLLEGMRIFKSVETINLRNCKLDDSYIDLINELFNIDNMKRVDISFNNLSKNAGKKLYNALKAGGKLEYFDCSFNPFCSDEYVCSGIMGALKNHQNLFHIGLSDSSRDSVIRFISVFPNLRSINLDDCKYKAKSLDYLLKQLTDKRFNIAEVSLRFVNIDTMNGHIFEKLIKQNKTLVHLNLYGCNLSDCAGSRIIREIDMNKTLVTLNLGLNNLGDDFCNNLGLKIPNNYTLQNIIISKNYHISNQNFFHVVESLVNNQTLTNLGDLTDTKIGVKLRESAELILNMNKKFLYNEILLDFSKTEKQNLLKLSMEGFNKVIDEIKIIDNDRERDINDLEKVEKVEDQLNKVVTKYDISLKQDDLDDFHFFNSHLLP